MTDSAHRDVEALREKIIDGFAGDLDDPTSYVQDAYAALDALLARLEQVEQERDEWQHGAFKFDEERRAAEAELARLREALNLALMHLEDERAIAAVRAALAPPDTAEER